MDAESSSANNGQSANPFASLISQSFAVFPSFTLESGVELKDVPVGYKTWGKLNEAGDNCLVICHALTGSSDVEDWYVRDSARVTCNSETRAD
jgi:homoserine O-acetyltransferase